MAKYEYFVLFRHLREMGNGDNHWWNAKLCFGNGLQDRVAHSEEEARALVERVKQEYPILDRDPSDRIETSSCGGLGVSIKVDRKMQIDDQVVEIIVKRREVTDWEFMPDLGFKATPKIKA